MKKNTVKMHSVINTMETSGDLLTSPCFEIEGGNGLEVFIQASMHGAEVQGNGVIYHLINFFEKFPLYGKMTLIPLVNPIACNTHSGGHTQGRFEFINGENWNRLYTDICKKDEKETKLDFKMFVTEHFKDKEEEIRKKFKKKLKESLIYYKNFLKENGRGLDGLRTHHLNLQIMAATSDIVLDLHTGPVATDYLYVAEYMKNRAKEMQFPFMLVIPLEFAGAFDEATFSPWVALTSEFEKMGRNIFNHFDAFTVELGSEEQLDLNYAKTQSLKILNYLAFKQVCDLSDVKKWAKSESVETNSQKQFWCLLKDYRRYYSPIGGLCHFAKKPGEHFKKGEVLYQILNFKEKKFLTDILAQNSGIIITNHTSANVRQGTSVLQVMENINQF